MRKEPLANPPSPIPSRINSTSSLHDTRPSSSLSNYDLLDDTLPAHSLTPFELTPSTSPTKPASIELPETKMLTPEDSMPNEHVEPFHSDKEDENPEDFLQSFFRCMGTAGDDTKKQQFKYFLQADSVADEWFDELAQKDMKDWNAIESAFHIRWPRKKASKKTTEEYEEEIIGLQLKTEDLGKKEKTAGREVYTHIVWADKMETIVKGVKIETTTMYIRHVRKDLPDVVREKVGAGHANWMTFLQAVRDVDPAHLKEGVDLWKKKQEEQEAIKRPGKTHHIPHSGITTTNHIV